jgi:hypothetical protein
MAATAPAPPGARSAAKRGTLRPTDDTGPGIVGDPATCASGVRIFARGSPNHLLEFIPDNLGGRIWNAYDHTIDTGVPITGDPAVYAGALLVFAPSTVI